MAGSESSAASPSRIALAVKGWRAQEREPVRISEFTSPNEPRFSCLVTPAPNGGWWWSVFSGDGSVLGSLVRGSSETSLARALEAAAEWAHHYPEGDERVG